MNKKRFGLAFVAALVVNPGAQAQEPQKGATAPESESLQEFPPPVVWGKTRFPAVVEPVALQEGGEFPAPVVFGKAEFPRVVKEAACVSCESFPPEVVWQTRSKTMLAEQK